MQWLQLRVLWLLVDSMKESVHSMEESVDSIKRVHWLLQESYDSLKEYSDSNKESFWLHIGVKTTLGVKTFIRKVIMTLRVRVLRWLLGVKTTLFSLQCFIPDSGSIYANLLIFWYSACYATCVCILQS